MNSKPTLSIQALLIAVVAPLSYGAVTVQVNGGLNILPLVNALNTPLPDGSVVDLDHRHKHSEKFI
ncbi:MAG: hypothetical protein ACI8T1_005260 [Verrucomicrobiales bacterium]|jgi:hypothetical protein